MKHLKVFINPVEDDSMYVSGKVGNGTYEFYAKVFDEPSEYGIDGGRISKLTIVAGSINDDPEELWNKVIVNYDRGWDIKPSNSKHMEIFHAILDELERLPSYEERIYNGSKIKKIAHKTKNKIMNTFSIEHY